MAPATTKFKFPPGGYFTPDDYDLIEFYLKPRVLGHNLAYDVVEETQVYGPDSSPWKIFDPNHLDFWFVSPTKDSEKVRYVFTNLTKIGKGGGGEEMRSRSRANMTKKAGSGTWVGERKDTIMDCDNNVIGETRLLVFKINEIDPTAGDPQFSYYKMHEYSLSGIYANFDLSSTLVLCKITYDSSKKCSFVKKNLSSSSSVHKKPAVLPKPKRKRVISTKSSNKPQIEKNLEGGLTDHLVEGSVCDPVEGSVGDHLVGGSVCVSLARRTVSDNFEGGAGATLVGVQCTIQSAEDIGLDCPCVDFGLEGSLSDNLVKGSASDSLVGVQNFTEFGEDLGVDYPPVNFYFGGSGESVCDYLVGVPNMNEFGDNLEGGAGANLVGVQCTIQSAEDIGLDCPRVDFGLEGSLSDNLVKGSASESLVGVQNFTEFGEDLCLDYPPVNFCFGGSGGQDPVEGSVCDYLVGVPNMNEFGDNLDFDDLHVGFSFEDEWIRELTNPIQEERVQDSTMTNFRKRKFESENSCMAKKVVLAAELFCCTGQFIGQGVFEKCAPALLDNLILALLMASFFVLLEVDIRRLFPLPRGVSLEI